MVEQRRRARINLIGWDNGRGLSHDLRLLRETLESLGHEVHFTPTGPKRHRLTPAAVLLCIRLLWRWLLRGCRGPWKFDANIMLEHVRPAYLGLARRNLFIPNPEWMSQRDERHLHQIDALLAKTRVAASIFQARGIRTLYIGFRSTDCLISQVPRQPRFLHLAGASRMKGTRRLLALWRRHPEWPPLLVLQAPQTAQSIPSTPARDNVEHRIATLDDIDEVRRLQNSHVFHLCLSEAEGWGHYIAEAMSCGAVVITCDVPPMNEMVRPGRGLLVSATAVGQLNAAMLYHFDEASLEAAIEFTRSLDYAQCVAIGAEARAWFETNERTFAGLLQESLEQLL
ncbi:glycosyltransferase [Rhodanobacter sp. MP7CTX1]|jgi:glycosyltransferase involved in cell wall biosynthesis|uniref:glycosyltransferase n=1 Tax=Rhodanobacter sp. MP7CTX1 TaxID=2723084 RepID=UPI00160791B5|nr:glycosyltransferase [Rhodanobacter sp. MP7CTX1]MBB6188119.1 glycosyltransferase involved in cell wall biosynthesis [Rhodanobacter sp. MP7CTX1]